MIGIYVITNTLNGKVYVGKSEISIEDRLKEHKSGTNSNEHLQRSIKKYGIDNFRFEVLEECEVSKCCERERYWIKKLNSIYPNGYNYTSGGENKSGFTFCEKSKKKMSESAKRVSKTEQGKAIHSKGGKARTWSNEERKKVSDSLKKLYSDKTKVPMYGKHHTEDWKKKQSERMMGEKHPMYGKHISDKAKALKSKAIKGRKWVNNGIEQYQIKPELLQQYLSNGYIQGMLPKIKKQ